MFLYANRKSAWLCMLCESAYVCICVCIYVRVKRKVDSLFPCFFNLKHPLVANFVLKIYVVYAEKRNSHSNWRYCALGFLTPNSKPWVKGLAQIYDGRAM